MDSKKIIIDSELREARGYLMDVISEALTQMNGHVEIENTVLPSVPLKGDWKDEDDGFTYMELIKGEHNVKDAMFHDVHAEKYTLDEVINKLDVSETYALTIAVREAQIANLVGEGEEITFDCSFAVSREDDSVEKDYIDRVEVDEDGKLNIVGHRYDAEGNSEDFDYGNMMYLDGFDELFAKISEMRLQKNVKEEHFLEPLTDEQWKVMSEIGYPYAPGNAKEHEAAPIPDMIYWRLAAGMMTMDDAVRAFSTTGYTIGRDPERTNEILASLDIMYQKLDNDFKPLTATDEQEDADLKPTAIQSVSDIDKLKAILDENFLYGEEVGKSIYFTQPIPFKNEAGFWQAVGVHCSTKNYEIEDNEGNRIPYDIFGRYDKVAASVKKAVEAPEEIQKYSLRIGRNDYNLIVSSMDGREGFVAMFGVPGNHDLVNLLEEPTVMDADVSRLFLICKGNNDAAVRELFAEAVVLRHFSDLIYNIHQQESIVAGYREAGLLGKPIDLVKPVVYEAQMSDKVAEVNDNGHYISIALYKDLEDANEHFEPTFFMDEGVKDYRQAMYDSLKETLNVHLEQSAKQAIRERITNSWQRTFTPNQVDALNRYQKIATPETPAREVFARLLHEVSQEPDVAQKSEKWIIDTAKELDEVAKGNTREEVQGLKR